MSKEDTAPKLEVIRITKRTSAAIHSLPKEQEFMRGLIEQIIKEMVSFPEEIKVTYTVGERTTIYQVECSQKVLGQIIGSKGKNIQSIRTITQGITARKGFRSIVEIPYYEPEPDNDYNNDSNLGDCR